MSETPLEKLKNELTKRHIHIYMPLSQAIEPSPEEIIDRYEQLWKSLLIFQNCGQEPKLVMANKCKTAFLVSDRMHNIRLLFNDNPLDSNLMENIISDRDDLQDKEKRNLLDHKAYLYLDYFYLLGSATPTDCARFAAQVLLTLLYNPIVLGYGEVSGELFYLRHEVKDFISNNHLSSADLFLLLASPHCHELDGQICIHTHGMVQFGAPDVQIIIGEEDNYRYYRELVCNTATYMIEKGPVLQPGHTAEITGDGIIYRIEAAPKSAEHTLGSLGAIRLVRQ